MTERERFYKAQSEVLDGIVEAMKTEIQEDCRCRRCCTYCEWHEAVPLLFLLALVLITQLAVIYMLVKCLCSLQAFS